MSNPKLPDTKRTTLTEQAQHLLEFVQIENAQTRFDRLIVPILLIIGIIYGGMQALRHNSAEAIFFALSVILLLVFAASKPIQSAIMGREFNRRHALHTILFWVYGVIAINLFQLLWVAPVQGKQSAYFFTLLICTIAVTLMAARSLLIMTKPFYAFFSTKIPLWEQLLLTLNESVAMLLVAGFWGWHINHLLTPTLFTVSVSPTYLLAVGGAVLLYYVSIQFMWIQGFNNWVSKNSVWVSLARLFAPFALIAVTMLIAQRLILRADPRTANLTGGESATLAVLAIAPIIWLIILVIILLVYTGRRGIRQRFLPDMLLERLPKRINKALSSISDMDMLLVLIALATSIPTYLLVIGGDSSQFVGEIRAQVLQTAGAIITNAEQVLALIFAAPFYLLILALFILYGYVLSRPTVSAKERDDLVERLPLSFLIILTIVLYLFALPFSQVFVEGRLPQLPQDLGHILAFNVVIPLFLLYAHYFIFIRIPYMRGQSRWRVSHNTYLNDQLRSVDRRLDDLNRQIQQLDQTWQQARNGEGNFNLTQNFDTLYRFVQVNSVRDDLNTRRLQIISDRQQLAEISEAPISLSVARLPVRIVSFGIPLLLAIQIYQWAVVNNGLREVIENPNLTVIDFFRAILEQTQF